MYLSRKFVLSTFILLGLASYLSLSAAEHIGGNFDRSNQNFNGDRFNNGNRFNNSFYRGVEDNGYGYDDGYIEPVAPLYGYGYFAPNSQTFPDETQANNLYWGEVQQMESQ